MKATEGNAKFVFSLSSLRIYLPFEKGEIVIVHLHGLAKNF